MNLKEILIYGTGGHSKVISQMIKEGNQYEVVGYIEDSPNKETFLGKKVLSYSDLPKDSPHTIFIAIGDNRVRSIIFQKLKSEMPNVILPSIISQKANIQGEIQEIEGTCIMPGVNINIDHQIGNGVVLNTGCTIDHDCIIKDFSFIGPGASLAGGVTVEDFSFIGLGSSVINGITVEKNTLVGAGAVVVNNIPANTLAMGVPAKPIAQRKIDAKFL